MRKLAFQFPSMLSYYPGTQIRTECVLQGERAAFYAAARFDYMAVCLQSCRQAFLIGRSAVKSVSRRPGVFFCPSGKRRKKCRRILRTIIQTAG